MKVSFVLRLNTQEQTIAIIDGASHLAIHLIREFHHTHRRDFFYSL